MKRCCCCIWIAFQSEIFYLRNSFEITKVTHNSMDTTILVKYIAFQYFQSNIALLFLFIFISTFYYTIRHVGSRQNDIRNST